MNSVAALHVVEIVVERSTLLHLSTPPLPNANGLRDDAANRFIGCADQRRAAAAALTADRCAVGIDGCIGGSDAHQPERFGRRCSSAVVGVAF